MVLLVFCAFPDADTAAAVTKTLVGEKLVACGTILPGARSIYEWEGKLEDASEVLVLSRPQAPLTPNSRNDCSSFTLTTRRKSSPSRPEVFPKPTPRGLLLRPRRLNVKS